MSRTILRKVLSQDVSKKSTEELAYAPATGKRLRVDRFTGGHEYSTKEVRVELVLRDGTDSLLAAGYGGMFQIEVPEEIVGDGTKAVVLRLINEGSGALHMTGIWEGIEEDVA